MWEGHRPGIYHHWIECKRQVDGYTGAKYKSFESLQEAKQAFDHPARVSSKEKSKRPKYYVVWEGFQPGIYTHWSEAQKQINGFRKPTFKTFGSRQLAEKAFSDGPDRYAHGSFKKTRDMTDEERRLYGEPDTLSVSVDAACNDKGIMEYRGVFTYSADEIFRAGPYPEGSNNVGEFLAIVHALAWLKKQNSHIPVYTDSRNAMKWVMNKKANTSIVNPALMNLIKRAENWLRENNYPNEIIKWQTKFWGEIPADFGRK